MELRACHSTGELASEGSRLERRKARNEGLKDTGFDGRSPPPARTMNGRFSAAVASLARDLAAAARSSALALLVPGLVSTVTCAAWGVVMRVLGVVMGDACDAVVRWCGGAVVLWCVVRWCVVRRCGDA